MTTPFSLDSELLIRSGYDPTTPIVVGVSGGADSMVLLHLLHTAGYRLVVAHSNFHLRGAESDRDTDFVSRTCASHYPDHPLEVIHFETESYAQQHHYSIEMAARELRYQWFEQLRQQYGASLIAVGHHADDDTETLLHNLARGTGGQGLRGMATIRDHIWRPLLAWHRSDIEAYLRTHHLDHIEDSTNQDTAIRRNLIRHRLIPLFEQLNPSFRTSVTASIERFGSEQALIDTVVRQWLARYFDPALQAYDLHAARQGAYAEHLQLLLTRCLMPLGFSADQISGIATDESARSGARYYSQSGEHMLELFRGHLYLLHPLRSAPIAHLPVCGEGTYEVPGYGSITLSTSLPTVLETSAAVLRVASSCAMRPLLLRPARSSDRFRPYGMRRGSRLLMDYLKDYGIPPSHRTAVMVLVAPSAAQSHSSTEDSHLFSSDDIIAIPPLQIADRAAVSDTDQPLYITMSQMSHPAAHILQRAAADHQSRKPPQHTPHVEK